MVLDHKPKVGHILHHSSQCIFSGKTSWTLSQMVAIPALLQPTQLKRCIFIEFIFESMNLWGHAKSHGGKDCQEGEIRFYITKWDISLIKIFHGTLGIVVLRCRIMSLDLAMENSMKAPIICYASLIWELLHLYCDFHPSLSQNALLTEALWRKSHHHHGRSS